MLPSRVLSNYRIPVFFDSVGASLEVDFQKKACGPCTILSSTTMFSVEKIKDRHDSHETEHYPIKADKILHTKSIGHQ